MTGTASYVGNWSFPNRILFGAGRIRELPKVCWSTSMNRPLLVTDPGLAALPPVQAALSANEEAGLPTAVFSEVKSNPTGANIADGVAAYRDGGHDGVIALGGGSALDVGKVVALMAEQDESLWEFDLADDRWKKPQVHALPPIIAVPTTAGTGSEVGRGAAITNQDLDEKRVIFHPRILPAAVISDPELTVGLPSHLTAATGLDAFSHGFEALCVPDFHPMADGIALEGMRLVAEALPRACAEGSDLEARAKMLAAASMGAVAFQKGLGAVHALSHGIGALFDTHHGLTNAVVLPYVMRHNEAAIAGKMELLGRVLGVDQPGFAGVLDWYQGFRENLGVPENLGEIGVSTDKADRIAEMALVDPSLPTNPMPASADQLKDLFVDAVEGRL